MNNIQIFSNATFGEVRVTGTCEQPLFNGTDLAKILGYRDGYTALRCVDEEDTQIVCTPKNSVFKYVNESGLYQLILKSQSENAKPFRKWVTSDVLPSIRKHGAYMTPETIEEVVSNPDLVISLATKLKEERAEKARLALQNEEQAKQLTISAPKVEYCDKVLSSKGLLTVNMIAAFLGISHIKLNKLLCQWNIQYKQSGTYYLYSQYRDKGYTEHKPYPYTATNGEIKTRQNMYWTEKGKEFILRIYNSKIAA